MRNEICTTFALMKGNLLHILFWSIILCLSCEHESPQPRQESERTVIVYAVAENSLSYSAVMDSMEMAATSGLPSQS